MKNIKYQSSILAGIYYLLTIILIILEYTFISIQKNEIVQQCQGSFQEALKKEKETFIIRKNSFTTYKSPLTIFLRTKRATGVINSFYYQKTLTGIG